jgi:hypothetical protein
MDADVQYVMIPMINISPLRNTCHAFLHFANHLRAT